MTGAGDDAADQPPDDLTATEVDALHRVELAAEWLCRAHGDLVGFHHKTGHAVDHLDAAQELLRDCGHDDLADAIRDDYLPRGVIDGDRWSYDVLESFESGFLADVDDLAERVRTDVAGGRRHVREREQEAEWKRQAERE
jgi:hypothetical protein